MDIRYVKTIIGKRKKKKLIQKGRHITIIIKERNHNKLMTKLKQIGDTMYYGRIEYIDCLSVSSLKVDMGLRTIYLGFYVTNMSTFENKKDRILKLFINN